MSSDRQTLTETIRALALDEGADLVGFAPVSRFENAPPHLHPRTLFPPVRSAIAIGLVQPRGALKAVEEGCYWQAYHCDSYWYLNEVESTRILRRIVIRLEQEGYTSLPVHNPFHSFSGRPVREGQLRGPDALMSLRVLGVAAGLGELGLSKVFLSPEFGPRQRIFGVLTDAELEPTPLFRGRVCDECGACARECEAGAIARERSVKFRIEDVEYAHGALDCEACVKVHQGMDPRFSPFWNGSEKEGEAPAYNRFCKERFRHLAICAGRGCLRACLDHLEKRGRIASRFRTPLVERPRWKLDAPPERKEKT